MMVPQLEAPAAPAPPPPVRLSIAAAPKPAPVPAPAPAAPAVATPALVLAPVPAPAAHAAPKPPASMPPMPMPAAGPGAKPYGPSYLKPEEKRGKGRAILTAAIVVVVLGGVAFAVAPMINSAQDNLNKSRKKDTEGFGGGEVGHAMELNRVLDETDPTRFERFAGEKPDKILPPPPYTLDVAAAVIPSGNVRGKISNVRFTLQDARLEVTGATYVLTLREGENFIADREMVLSLRLKPGENIQGKSWTISKDMTTGGPGVAKKWLDLRDQPPKQAAFAGGYALKLEFDKASAGIIAGKIYLALPDQEQSVIAGEFSADIRVPSAAGSKRTRPSMSSFDDE
jgi:hypothetical protein